MQGLQWILEVHYGVRVCMQGTMSSLPPGNTPCMYAQGCFRDSFGKLVAVQI